MKGSWETPSDVERWLAEYNSTAVGRLRKARDVRVMTYEQRGIEMQRVVYLLEVDSAVRAE